MTMVGGRADRYELAKASDLGDRGTLNAHAQRMRLVAAGTVAVPDPMPVPDRGPGQRVIATVNRRVDILEYERSHDRISNDAYIEGRIIQAVFERAGLGGAGAAWREGSRVDAEVAKELAVLRRVTNGQLLVSKARELRNLLGEIDARIVREVLGENRSYAEVSQTLDLVTAAMRDETADRVPSGKGGYRPPPRGEAAVRRVSYIAQRFRDALESLASSRRRR